MFRLIRPTLVFLCALAARYIFVSELRAGSYLGNVRVSDSGSYFELAQRIAAGTASFEPYWQAPLYPLLLAPFQLLFGESLPAVQWLHLLIGSMNCVLVFHLTETLFGLRSARVAAVIAIFYAPFWLFDVQPLPANLTMLFYLLMVLSYLRYRTSRRIVWLAGTGLLVGAAILSHGLAIFTIPVFVYDLASRRSANGEASTHRSATVAVFLATAFLAPAAVSVRNSVAAGAPIAVSYNAGINFYIGNHHDLEQTLTARSGYEWSALLGGLRKRGVDRPAEFNRHYFDQAIAEWVESPKALLVTSVKKILLAISGSEPKRNFPIYELRESSWALRALLWELELFGVVFFAFPGGLMLPLALLGFAWSRADEVEGRHPAAFVSFAGWVAIFHMVGMVVFFPTARYRAPASVLLLPYAAMMLPMLWDRLRSGNGRARRQEPRPARAAIAVVSIFLLVNVVSTNVFRHPSRDRAEHLYYGARWAMQQLGDIDSAALETRMVEQATEAMRTDPAYPEPVELLAMYYSVRDPARSVALFERLGELAPDDAKAKRLLSEFLKDREAGP